MTFELISIEMILAILGAIAGLAGLFLHYVGFRKEKPILKVDTNIASCNHYCASSVSQLKTEFTVHNKGNKGTRLTSLSAFVILNGIKYGDRQGLRKAIDPHSSIQQKALFLIHAPITSKVIYSNFALSHTHGVTTFSLKSTKSEESLKKDLRYLGKAVTTR